MCATSARAYECVERRQISVFLTLDASSSMHELPASGTPGYEEAGAFARELLVMLEAAGDLEEAGAMLFGSVSLTTPLKTDVAALDDDVLEPYQDGDVDLGSTRLYAAIVDSVAEVRRAESDNVVVYVVLTDGDDDDTSGVSDSVAADALSTIGGVAVELIYAGSGLPVALELLALDAGPHVRARAVALDSLAAITAGIVDRTCANFRPEAHFTMSPSDGVDVGIDDRSRITFDASGSRDLEDDDDELRFEWNLFKPNGERHSLGDIDAERDFVASERGMWRVELTVFDTAGASAMTSKTFEVRDAPTDIELQAPTMIDALDELVLLVPSLVDRDGGPPYSLVWEILSAPPRAERQPYTQWSDAPRQGWVTTERDITVLTDGTRVGAWSFKVTARDDEGDVDAETRTVDVRNLPPDITLDGQPERDVGGTLAITSAASDDPDGGALVDPRWRLVQVPSKSGLQPIEPFAIGAAISRVTTLADAGTWIFRFSAADNEGEPGEQDFEVLIDAPPEITLSGPELALTSDDLTLDASASEDPDSPTCVAPLHCHLNSEGPPKVSPGITRWTWRVVDVPAHADVVPGDVADVLGLAGGGPELTIPAGSLAPGAWVFELEIEDGEGNVEAANHPLEVVSPDAPPLALVWGPLYRLADPSGVIAEPIVLDGSASFDPDNLARGEALPGITRYTWSTPLSPPLCPPLALADGAMTVAWPAGAVPLVCHGATMVSLTVTDDDAAPTSDSAAWFFIVSNCAGLVCIDVPTTTAPAVVELADQTEVEIAYYVNAAVYALADCGERCAAELTIAHEAAPGMVLRRFVDPRPLATTLGGQLTFRWNGLVDDAGDERRPSPGRYDVRVKVSNLFGPGTSAVAEQRASILIAVTDVWLHADSDRHLALDAAERGQDLVSVGFSLIGGAQATQVRTRVFEVGSAIPLYDRAEPVPIDGMVRWDGREDGGELVAPGRYALTVAAVGPAGELDESELHEVTAYRVDVALDGVDPDDEDDPGAFVAVGARRTGRVTVSPADLAGEVVLREVGASLLESPAGDLQAGVRLPVGSPLVVVGRAAATTATRFEATYLPTGAAPSKATRDAVTLTVGEVDARVACSDDGREANPGVFVHRRVATGPIDFAAERFMMRRVHLATSHRLEGIRVALREGGQVSARAVLFGPTIVGGPAVELGAEVELDASFFDPSGALGLDLFVRGLDRGRVDLEVELLQGGVTVASDAVRLRIDDLPPLSGTPFPEYPHWWTSPIVGVGQSLQIAVDPFHHDERRALPARVYVVAHKTAAQWALDPTLVDVTGGPDDFTVPPLPGSLAQSSATVWPAVAVPQGTLATPLDIVVDYGGCPDAPQLPAFGELDGDDLVLPLDRGQPSVSAIGDLTAPGPYATNVFEYGNDVEENPAHGAVCTPREDPNGRPCTLPDGAQCRWDEVCVDDDGGGARCTAIDPAAPACATTEVCVNSDGNDDAHCRPRPVRVAVPIGYDTLGQQIAREHCSNGGDDDGDHRVDCDDAKCAYAPVCATEICTNGVDDNSDGLVDCADFVCRQACWPGFRLRARVVLPLGAPGNAPLVIMAHGRHGAGNQIEREGRWQRVFDPRDQNYRGHDYLQRHLASHGYASISVDLDEVVGESWGYPWVAGGNRLRGWLVLKNLEHALTLPQLAGVDRHRIHLFGHSRGGEAALEAWYLLGDIAARGPATMGAVGADALVAGVVQADVASVVTVAPTTFREVVPPIGMTPYFLLFGTADGDVNGAQDGVRPRRDYDRAAPRRAFVQLRGGNHNHFNTSWVDNDADYVVALDELDGASQRAAALAYVLAWLESLERAPVLAELFAQPASRAFPPGVPALVVPITQARVTGTRIIDDSEAPAHIPGTTSDGSAIQLTDVTLAERSLLDAGARFFGDGFGGFVAWDAPGSLTVILGDVDFASHATLALRVAQQPADPRTTTGGLRFDITLEDIDGRASTIPSELAAMTPGRYDVEVLGTQTTAALFQSLRFPLDRFLVGGVALDLAHIRSLRLSFGAAGDTQTGAIAIDDLEVE